MISDFDLEQLNKKLKDYAGRFEDGRPHFRVSWVNDQLEKRFVKTTEDGIELLFPEVREVRKYNYMKDVYILEILQPVDPIVDKDLVDKTSYECIWQFRTDNGTPIPPKFEFIKVLIDSIHDAVSRAPGVEKYPLPEIEYNSKEGIEARVKIIEDELYGNENSVTDALAMDEAVGYGVRNRSESKNVKVG